MIVTKNSKDVLFSFMGYTFAAIVMRSDDNVKLWCEIRDGENKRVKLVEGHTYDFPTEQQMQSAILDYVSNEEVDSVLSVIAKL